MFAPSAGRVPQLFIVHNMIVILVISSKPSYPSSKDIVIDSVSLFNYLRYLLLKYS